MNSLKALCNRIDGINEMVGKVVAWATLLMVLVTFADVVMRYALNTSYVFTQELEWHLFAFVFLMGAGYTLSIEGHVRVGVFYDRLSIKGKAWINVLGVLLLLIPSCLMFIKSGIPFVVNSFSMMEGSPNPGGIPFRFILKACIPAGYTLLLIQGIALGIRSFLQLAGVSLEKGE